MEIGGGRRDTSCPAPEGQKGPKLLRNPSGIGPPALNLTPMPGQEGLPHQLSRNVSRRLTLSSGRGSRFSTIWIRVVVKGQNIEPLPSPRSSRSISTGSAVDPSCRASLPRSEEHTSELQSLRHLVC